MTETEIQNTAREAVAWWYCNQPQMDEEALSTCAKAFADVTIAGEGGLNREFHSVPASWHQQLQETFIAEYQRLRAGHTHGPGLITDLAEIRRTFDALPAITPDMVPCPLCFTPLVWLHGAGLWRCDGCKRVFTSEAVQPQEETHTKNI